MQNSPKSSWREFRDFWSQFNNGFPEKHIGLDAEKFVDYCDIKQDESALEIGVGGGNSCRLIAEIARQCFFIDFNWEAVNAQKRRDPCLNILQADGTELPFEDRSFSKVLARYVVHNFPDHAFRSKFYAESARVLLPGGELILGRVPNRTGMFFDLKHYLDRKMWHRLQRKHHTFWPSSIREMKKELSGLGLTFIHIRKTPEPNIQDLYHMLRQAGSRFFLPLLVNAPIIYNFVDIKFKKVGESVSKS